MVMLHFTSSCMVLPKRNGGNEPFGMNLVITVATYSTNCCVVMHLKHRKIMYVNTKYRKNSLMFN